MEMMEDGDNNDRKSCNIWKRLSSTLVAWTVIVDKHIQTHG